MQKTNISYLTHTWNPIAMRCTPVSPGCANCWHLRMANRLCRNPQIPFNEATALEGAGPFVLRERELSAPLRTWKPAVIGVQFMGDLFHEDVPLPFIDRAMGIMLESKRHTFLILTKRPERMARYWHQQLSDAPSNMDNIWHGLTVCNQAEADAKIPELLRVPGKRFLSIEPMLGEIDLAKIPIGRKHLPLGKSEVLYHNALTRRSYFADDHLVDVPRIDAVILGGETSTGARPMHPDWVRSVRDQCQASGTPFYLKQNGEWSESISGITSTRLFEPEQLRYLNDDGTITPLGMGYQPAKRLLYRVGSKRAGRLLDGQLHNSLPWRQE